MRILAVSHPCVTDVNQQFYAELEKLGHEVQLIVPANFRTTLSQYKPTKVKRWPSFKGNVKTYPVGMSKSIPLHFYLSNLRSAIRSFSPDVLIVEEEPYSLSAWQSFYASRGMKMKRVVYSAQNIYKKYPVPIRNMEKYVLSQSDLVLAVSQEVVQVLRQKRYFGRHMLFPLGVDTEQFTPNREKAHQMREKANIRQEVFVVGFVGRLVEEKGIHILLQTIAQCADPNIHFLLVGNGPLLQEVRDFQTRHPGMVTIAEQVQHREVQDWINMMDVLLLPSITKWNWKEQFGRIIVEANACKVPVIGSNCGEIPRLLELTTGGWVVPENDAKALREKIIYVKNHDEERLSVAESGLEYVHHYLSKKVIAANLSRNLNEIVHKEVI